MGRLVIAINIVDGGGMEGWRSSDERGRGGGCGEGMKAYGKVATQEIRISTKALTPN